MTALALTKNYSDTTLLFASDIHGMWTELETLVNGGIESEHVTTGWANWTMVTLAKDTDFTLGVSDSAIFRYYDTEDEMVFAHDTTFQDNEIKIAGTAVATLNSSGNLAITKDVYFYTKSTRYPLSWLVHYQKPVLIYVDADTINVEQNVPIANRTLIVFPSGPLSVTENTAFTSKHRQLKLSEAANGYSEAHVGPANSGMRVSLSANKWYFVYAVTIKGGNDVGAGFVLVGDSVKPSVGNKGTLDNVYGENEWVYLGLFRYGHGLTLTTTMIPFIQDHAGWHTFTGRAASNGFFGILTSSSDISETSYSTLDQFTAADTGAAAPSTCSMLKISYRPLPGNVESCGNFIVSDSSDNVLWDLPSFSVNLESDEAHGWYLTIPNTGCKLKAKTGTV